jgi:hypothetical protein
METCGSAAYGFVYKYVCMALSVAFIKREGWMQINVQDMAKEGKVMATAKYSRTPFYYTVAFAAQTAITTRTKRKTVISPLTNFILNPSFSPNPFPFIPPQYFRTLFVESLIGNRKTTVLSLFVLLLVNNVPKIEGLRKVSKSSISSSTYILAVPFPLT